MWTFKPSNPEMVSGNKHSFCLSYAVHYSPKISVIYAASEALPRCISNVFLITDFWTISYREDIPQKGPECCGPLHRLNKCLVTNLSDSYLIFGYFVRYSD